MSQRVHTESQHSIRDNRSSISKRSQGRSRINPNASERPQNQNIRNSGNTAFRFEETYKIYQNGKDVIRRSSENAMFGGMKISDGKDLKNKTIPYFMETLEVKKHIIQIEKENKKLRIHYERIKNQNHKNMLKLQNQEEDFQDEVTQDAINYEATSIIEMEKEIKDLAFAIDLKNREIEASKAARRNISEKALESNIEDNQKKLAKYRSKCFKYMKKYKGDKEDQGMSPESFSKYQYQNLLLQEYEEMLQELQNEISSLYKKKNSKQVEIESLTNRSGAQMGKITEIKDDIDYLFEKKDEMEGEERRRAQYDNEDCNEMENEKKKLNLELKELNQKKKEYENEISQQQALLKDDLDKLKKNSNKLMKDIENLMKKSMDSNEENDSLSLEDKQSSKADDDESVGEKDYLRRVDQEDVAHLGLFIKYGLRYRRKTVQEAYNDLIKEENSSDNSTIGLGTIETNLRKSPIYLHSKEQARLVARYLVEDNFEDNIWYDSKARNNKIIIKSIWNNLVGTDPLPSIDAEEKTHKELMDVIFSHKNNISLEISRNGVNFKYDSAKVQSSLKQAGIELNQDQFTYLIVQLAGPSYSMEDLRFGEIQEIFSAEETEEYFAKIRAGEKLNSYRGRNKRNTLTQNMSNEENSEQRNQSSAMKSKLDINTTIPIYEEKDEDVINLEKQVIEDEEEQNDSSDLQNNSRRENLNKESVKMVERNPNFNIQQSDANIQMPVINFNPVLTFNDNNYREVLEKEEKMKMTYEEVEEIKNQAIKRAIVEVAKMSFQFSFTPSQNVKDQIITPRQAIEQKSGVQKLNEMAQGFSINIQQTETFNDTKVKEHLMELEQIKADWSTLDAKTRTNALFSIIVKSDTIMKSDTIKTDEKKKEISKKPVPQIMVNQVETFNDQEKIGTIEEQNKQITNLEDLERDDQKRKSLVFSVKQDVKEDERDDFVSEDREIPIEESEEPFDDSDNEKMNKMTFGGGKPKVQQKDSFDDAFDVPDEGRVKNSDSQFWNDEESASSDF